MATTLTVVTDAEQGSVNKLTLEASSSMGFIIPKGFRLNESYRVEMMVKSDMATVSPAVWLVTTVRALPKLIASMPVGSMTWELFRFYVTGGRGRLIFGGVTAAGKPADSGVLYFKRTASFQGTRTYHAGIWGGGS